MPHDEESRPVITLAELESNIFLGGDGSIDEGQVAAFLYDLTDENISEPHDNLIIDGADLAEVMGPCKVRQGSWRRPDGIDHLIWCLENQVDSAITGGNDYFTERENHPTHENESDHSWDEDDVRTSWLKNLYDVSG